MYLQQKKKFDWLFIVDPIWLVWHTYFPHSLTHWPIDPPITYPTRRLRGIFLQKNNSKMGKWLIILGLEKENKSLRLILKRALKFVYKTPPNNRAYKLSWLVRPVLERFNLTFYCVETYFITSAGAFGSCIKQLNGLVQDWRKSFSGEFFFLQKCLNCCMCFSIK